jgi:hypothetical protein
MKPYLTLAIKLLTIYAFAAITAVAIGFILSVFLQGILNMQNVNPAITNIVTIIFGIVFGYRLNDLIRDLKK